MQRRTSVTFSNTCRQKWKRILIVKHSNRNRTLHVIWNFWNCMIIFCLNWKCLSRQKKKSRQNETVSGLINSFLQPNSSAICLLELFWLYHKFRLSRFGNFLQVGICFTWFFKLLVLPYFDIETRNIWVIPGILEIIE